MINIIDKKDCVGCKACEQVCPKHCISMCRDMRGFQYPIVEIKSCIKCGLCDNVCPVINTQRERVPIKTYGAFNNNNSILLSSSSGGVFYALAKTIIKLGGVVFGVKFDENWIAKHSYTESLDGIKAFMGSKYVQSEIGHSYKLVRTFLKQNRYVLFSGTPCQIAGLKNFLRKDNIERLLLVDVICQGNPSPSLWAQYLKQRCLKKTKKTKLQNLNIIDINLRDKKNGWRNYCFHFRFIGIRNNQNIETIDEYIPRNEDPYFWCFHRNLTVMPSCFDCPAKGGKSGSDITIGDFWGANRLLENENYYGMSVIYVYTEKGLLYLNKPPISLMDIDYNEAVKFNKSLIRSEIFPREYFHFWNLYETKGIDSILKFYYKNRYTYIERLLKNPIKNILKYLNIK